MRLRVEEGEHLELEEHGLELIMANLGLEENDLCRKEDDGKAAIRDWLDDWIQNLGPGTLG